MNRDASPASALDIARLLLARESASSTASDPAMAGAALQRTCMLVFQNLRDSMGVDGTNALLVRALARTEADHPALKSISRLSGNSILLDGVVASVEAHGVAAVSAAIEALLAALIVALGRLIGEDMAIRLMDQGALSPRTSEGGHSA
jgi:hypothetical protein